MAKSRSDYQRERERTTRKMDDLLRSWIDRMQTAMYLAALEVINDLKTDKSDQIKFTVANVGLANKAKLRVEKQGRREQIAFVGWIIEKVKDLLGLNKRYFRSFQDYDTEKIDEKVIRNTLLRLGYDSQKDKLIAGGWLDSLTDSNSIALQVAQDMNRALASKMGLTEFRRQFRSAFTGLDQLGYLERHYQTFTHDLFQQVDRGVQNEYAESLNLNHAVYSGTIKDNTRPFCLSRVNKIYTRDEIEGWEHQEWKGKGPIPGYNPLVHLGGYNCRHHLSWISEELVKRMNKKVNEYG